MEWIDTTTEMLE